MSCIGEYTLCEHHFFGFMGISCCKPFVADPTAYMTPSNSTAPSFTVNVKETPSVSGISKRSQCSSSGGRYTAAFQSPYNEIYLYKMVCAVKMHGFSSETLHLAVEYFDRLHSYLYDDSMRLAMTCVWIAAKLNENRSVSWRMNARVCARFTSSDIQTILSTEMRVLQALNYNLMLPIIWTVAHELCEELLCK